MAGCQLTYYSSVELSNAGTATVLQYTAPAIIMLYTAVRAKKMPRLMEIGALVLALFGTFVLATHGDPNSLAISDAALAWGLTSAVMMAVYNLLPLQLMKKYGTFCVIGWGMLIGGILMCVFTKPWHVIGTWISRQLANNGHGCGSRDGSVFFLLYGGCPYHRSHQGKSLCLCGTGNSDGGYCPDNAYCLYVAGLFWNSLYYGSGSDTVN